MADEVLLKGVIARALPQAGYDGASAGEPVRIGRFKDMYVLPAVRKQHVLADEGSYFVCNNAQTGVATPAAATFVATTPLAIITNTDSPGNTAAKRLYLDYLTLVATAAGGWASAGVNLQLAVYLDNTDRYSSGGSDLSANIVSPNQDAPAKNTIAKVRFGALTALAATSAVRAICGMRIIRPAVSATVATVVGETVICNFGGVEMNAQGSITVANANIIPIPLPPIIIGPNQCALIYFIMNGTTPSAASFAPELGWWER